jgi:hypothetical protein
VSENAEASEQVGRAHVTKKKKKVVTQFQKSYISENTLSYKITNHRGSILV